MRIVQINTVPNLSTGTVMLENHKRYLEEGHESWRMWGRGRESEDEYEYKFNTAAEVIVDVIETRLFGKPGFHSKIPTKRLVSKLESIQPDLVHLHNLHGYYLNVDMLFRWLANSNCNVEWTLHDCWAFTGHCTHFSYVGCTQWEESCARETPCIQLREYPKTYSKHSCRWSFEQKKNLFTMLDPERMKLITPSEWLAGLTRRSYLAKYPVEVRYNTIDNRIFKPTASTFRESTGLNDRFIILGVASKWGKRKGIEDFIKLRSMLSDEYHIVLVGLNRKQIEALPRGILGLEKTNSKVELAEIYTACDVFVNPTYEDNYPTVNLEAESCGTPVITYDVGGCSETIKMPESTMITVGDIAGLKKTIENHNRLRV